MGLWFEIFLIEQRGTEKFTDSNFESLAQFMDDAQLHGRIGTVDDIGYG